jgi:hypothetical protein
MQENLLTYFVPGFLQPRPQTYSIVRIAEAQTRGQIIVTSQIDRRSDADSAVN